jgi:NADPH-dependent 2,4-dienoyl-CoA reductase/sulfur reductase-like enzyme
VLEYDRLIVSPGIDFQPGAIEGYDAAAAEVMPHAWRAGPQTALLRRQLEAMEDGGEFLIAPPARPYRCTTAPYERASLVAHYFTQAKPKCRIVVLDANDRYPLQDLFEDGWNRFYPGMVEVLPGEFSGGARAVKPGSMEVVGDDEIFRPAVANIIPPQTAGRIALDAGLADETGWCPVDATGFESALAPGVHVIGDAAIAAPMPKAAYSARRQAHICAVAVAKALTGLTTETPGLGGACWSYLTPVNAVRERAEFAIRDGVIERTVLDISPLDETDEIRTRAATAGADWYRAITADMFG